ncbi:MAG: triose-phosphate isomerase [Candidatus Moranbacteria bacterium RIFCSPHIGHO2_01_FULL_55_24]|nr:MAG: triose-phosphate isomerase [Candidatus Moranbacteria bacterium RIFCSPHIGHO2_01_FULL_55_24]
MARFLIVGNLKMNPLSREEVSQYLSVLQREMSGKKFEHAAGVLCPPALYLNEFSELPQGIAKGAQNVFWEKSGAYTGELSPVMLKNDGVEYVIVGHSERRQYGNEDDRIVREKAHAVLKALMVPIVCVGETGEERAQGETDRVLEHQVQAVFEGLSKLQAEKIILAYEPRWAIGTDTLPTTNEILQVKVLIRKLLAEMFDSQAAERVRVLYGGSVKSSFLGAVSWEAGMDGVLVGRESLFPYEIVKMLALFEEQALSLEA